MKKIFKRKPKIKFIDVLYVQQHKLSSISYIDDKKTKKIKML